ncbi:MAG: aldehyde dehydrogenase family protein [Candidatus Kapaibacterium sp.]
MNHTSRSLAEHETTLNQAITANKTREFYAHWPEPPSGKIYGETANADGQAAFEARLNKAFVGLDSLNSSGTVGEESSPFGFPLGITYPYLSVETLASNATAVAKEWRAISPKERALILIECLERASKHFFEIGYATMHTTGQGFVMAFQASGPHAFDRALEAIAMGYSALEMFNPTAEWTKPMGKMAVTLRKKFVAVPKGVNCTIGCSTFPLWNSLPGMFASLITGNTTIAKTHPKVTLPMAIFVASCQQTLTELGINPHIIQLGADSSISPMTFDIAWHPAVTTIDYTGSATIGSKLERLIVGSNKVLFTEKVGVNCCLIESTDNLDAVLDNLAFGITLYSGQMCTAPQNFFIPKNGVMENGTLIPLSDVASRLAAKIDGLVFNEKIGPGTLGALQNPATLERLHEASQLGGTIVRPSAPVAQQGFAGSRTVSPLIMQVTENQKDIYEKEWFGPIGFVIPVEDFNQGIDLMAESAKTHGALSAAVYTTDDAKKEHAENELLYAGAPVAFNFTGPIWVNQSAAFSDFHGTGANPAGSASFADLSFVCNRYNVIGSREKIG